MKKEMKPKLKVGLIVDGYVVSKHIDELVQLSLKSDFYEIACIIIQETDRYQENIAFKALQYIKRCDFKEFFNNATFKLLIKIESIAVKRTKTFKDFFNKFDLRSYEIESLVVNPNVSTNDLVYRYSEEDLATIERLNLNLLIKGGSGILKGRILDVCRKGIISFHYADNDIDSRGPLGFWEVFNKEKRTGFIIQLLKDEIDGGDVIYKGYIATKFMYSLNLASLYNKSSIFLHKAIESLDKEGSETQVYTKKTPYEFLPYTTPTLIQQIRYVVHTIKYICYKIYRKIMSKSYRWGVAYQFVEDWDEVSLSKSKKIKNPPNRFLADPFIWYRDGLHYCFVEDYDYKTGLGCISVYEITEDSYKELGVALNEDFHLAYPFLLENDGELYMCPETCQSNEIRLYRCVDFPLKWSLEKTLIKDVSAADTNIFYRDGRWWLLTAIDSGELDDHCSELHVFWSDELLSDTWQPHSKNPVIFDSLKARNGGLLFRDGDVYRVFQRQGWDLYGEAFGVAKISKLTESTYDEDIQFTVEPNFFDGLKGTHTYSFKDGLMAIDFLELVNHTK